MRYDKIVLVILIFAVIFSCDSDLGSSADLSGTGTGQGGSMTRFAINGNYMYVVNNTDVQVFEISDGKFLSLGEVSIGFRMETIFAKGEYLYLGANDGMYIYSIADPETPSFVFRYQHIVSCDPVVVQGNRAYVTLRSGMLCNRGVNTLHIVDITNPYAPSLIKEYPMDSPHGLGIDNNTLFICEGEYGLKVFNIQDEQNMTLISHRKDFFAYDVIAKQGIATITGEDGIFQFSYGADGNDLGLLSKIPVTREQL